MAAPTLPPSHAPDWRNSRSTPSVASQRLAAGGGQLDGLRAASKSDPKGAIKEVAKQFEALFMQEVMKSMRAASANSSMSSGMLDNNGTEMATGLLDQQYATEMTGRPGGLAEAIARQLERQTGLGPVTPAPAGGYTLPARPAALQNLPGAQMSPGAARAASASFSQGTQAAARYAQLDPAQRIDTPAEFVQAHADAAEAAAADSGIPAHFMLAQAAHETGWGRKQIVGQDGTLSNNLFGIKAGPGWTGPSVVATTTEVVNGQPQKVQARFRAYASAEDSFRDYARLIGNSPRYQGVMNSLKAGDSATPQTAAAFAQGLQRAGYATDPQYAAKLGRVIDTTARVQRQLDAGQQARADAPGPRLNTSA
ncbi:flagellar assembly peptidoglycan hydrolase FlgJ [Leptothrix discophora]|uniref:Peptidoglycan hydrolase FlgJ n=1 Tax=Leptothrix discophora TaxID=89 RepID=A0ABT9FY22_LEPDI|nr:flagellar assembly peptidoglycan hydrolase FlgJ [Leptothrix discophora]MDP4299143.1 flagellar assembly peptidoglycan hydrolase FlgJ [Leptothrix discophora]